jgi:hypothetical protein
MYVVANGADLLDGFSLWILERPILALQAGDEGTLFAASHRDEHMRASRELVGEFLWPFVREVDSDLLHRFDHDRMYLVSGLGPRRNRVRPLRIREFIEPTRRHLGAPSIMDACKNDGDHVSSSLEAARGSVRAAAAGVTGTSQRNRTVAAAAPAS